MEFPAWAFPQLVGFINWRVPGLCRRIFQRTGLKWVAHTNLPQIGGWRPREKELQGLPAKMVARITCAWNGSPLFADAMPIHFVYRGKQSPVAQS
jgi:hypothetical protein